MSTKFNTRYRVQLKFIIILLMIFILGICWILNYHFEIIEQISNKKWIFFLVIVIVLFLTYLLYQLRVFDYDSMGEVITIKYLFPFSQKKTIAIKLFELPKENIVSYKLQKSFFKKKLEINFKNSRGIIMKKYFDVSTCTKSQILKLKLEDLVNKTH